MFTCRVERERKREKTQHILHILYIINYVRINNKTLMLQSKLNYDVEL